MNLSLLNSVLLSATLAQAASISLKGFDPALTSDAENSVMRKSPASTYPDLPKDCRGQPPNMLGTYNFFGFRLEGVPAADMSNLASWDEGMSKRAIGGVEWVTWEDKPYYLLAINSPAGLVRRFCAFDARDNRTSTCTGMDYRDESVTEILYVTETDDDCNAQSFSITTTKAFVPGVVCGDVGPPVEACTSIANMFVDKVMGVRASDDYPATPADIPAY